MRNHRLAFSGGKVQALVEGMDDSYTATEIERLWRIEQQDNRCHNWQ